MKFSRRQRVFVEMQNGVPVRIYNRVPYDPAAPSPVEVSRVGAVSCIRGLVFARAAGRCERCGTPITEQTGHLHERIPRSKGGEISIYNSVALCPPCHVGKTGEHANRFPQWRKKWQTNKSSEHTA